MKITIDTKEDSHEDIRKIVALLSQIIGKEAVTGAPQNLFDSSSSPELPNLMGIFDASNQTQQASEPIIPEQPQQAQRLPKVELY